MSTTRSIAPRAPATEPRKDRAALVLWGHGAAGGPGVLDAHVRRLERRGGFTPVCAACLRGAPRLSEVMAELTAARVYLVPMLMADGFLARTALNAAVDELGRDAERLHLAPVLGGNPRLADLLLDRGLAAAGEQGWRAAASTLLIIGHGTPRDRNSRATAFAHAAEIARRGPFARVAAAFLEDRPSLAEAAGCGGANLVVVGLFADAGAHGEDDVHRAMVALGRPYTYAGAIGRAPEIAELVLEQVALAERLIEAA